MLVKFLNELLQSDNGKSETFCGFTVLDLEQILFYFDECPCQFQAFDGERGF